MVPLQEMATVVPKIERRTEVREVPRLEVQVRLHHALFTTAFATPKSLQYACRGRNSCQVFSKCLQNVHREQHDPERFFLCGIRHGAGHEVIEKVLEVPRTEYIDKVVEVQWKHSRYQHRIVSKSKLYNNALLVDFPMQSDSAEDTCTCR
eukprot:1258535-Amphidinium_carterae.1